MTFAIDLPYGNLNRTIKRNTSDKTLIIILQSIKTTYAKYCVYNVNKYMKNIYLANICRYVNIVTIINKTMYHTTWVK